jgi:hypothetical protein
MLQGQVVANSEPEKTNADKLMKLIEKKFEVWFQNIPDTYGGHGVKKPFDGILSIHGIAFEFKFQDGGIHYNLDTWRKDEPHQELGLWQFCNSGAGVGILCIAWKRLNGRIDFRWVFSPQETKGVSKLKLEDQKTKKDLLDYLGSIIL